jgi:hypothetical protein
MKNQRAESGVVVIILALIIMVVVVIFAFARAYEARDGAGSAPTTQQK